MSGPYAAAWKLDWGSPNSALVSIWLINAPTYHPMWEWWAVMMVHLRDMEGVPEAIKQYPGASHEFQIVSLDPGHKIDIDALERHDEALFMMEPPDVVVQFGGVNDEQAAVVAKSAALMICSGCNPDEDYRRWWTAAVLRGAEQVRTGGMMVAEASV